MGRENVAGHARVFFTHFDTAPKPAVFADVAIPCLPGALGATGGVIGLRRLFLCMRQRPLQSSVRAHGLVLVLRLCLCLVLVAFLVNGLLQHVNAAGCGTRGDVHRALGSFRGDIHRGLSRVNRSVAQKPGHRAKRGSERFTEPCGYVI